MNKKAIGFILAAIALMLLVTLTIYDVSAYYSYKNTYDSYWELADRTSTLSAKEQYITQFVDLLNRDRNKFADYNALFLKTPQNSFDNNVKALTTLRDRLRDISKMDETSFAYQTAIQQITSQEQGEAGNMMFDIQGCYYLQSYPLRWEWISLISWLFVTGVAFIASILIMKSYIDTPSKEEEYFYGRSK